MLNPTAVRDLATASGVTTPQMCEASGVSRSQMCEALHLRKGLNRQAVEALAAVLRCQPGTIAPGWDYDFIAIRPADRASTMPVNAWVTALLGPRPSEK